MFQSMLINESDVNYENSINDMNIEYTNSYSGFRTNNFDKIQNDFDILKNSILFLNWSPNILKNFIEDSHVVSKNFKYQILIDIKNNLSDFLN